MSAMLSEAARDRGARYDVPMAEEFRVVRFGGLSALLEAFGERLDSDAERLEPDGA